MHSFRSLTIIILLSMISLVLLADNNVIYNVKVMGNQNVDTNLILTTLTVKVGDYYNPEQISSSIKSLYRLNVFDDIQIDKNSGEQGIELIVKVIESPIVHGITYKGNHAFSGDKLDEISSIRKGNYWSGSVAAEYKRKMLEEYKKKGYHLADIEFDKKMIDGNKVDLTIKIDEGKKIVVKKITFEGNRDFTSKQLMKKMKTKRSALLSSGQFEQEKFDQDLRDIVAFYNNKGYVDAKIEDSQVQIYDNRYINLQIKVFEGQKYLFDKIVVKGNTRFTSEVILSKFRFKTGDVFDSEKFNKQLQQVSSLYYEEGYIYASFDHQIEKNGDKVVVNLNIEENTRAKIHEIVLTGNRKTKEKVIRRQLTLAPGDYFRQSQVMQTQQNIYNLGFFEPDMKLDYQPINKNGDIDLSVDLTDKTSGSANGGVGYNSTDKFIGQFSFGHNNLWGNNWSSNVKYEFGNNLQNFEFEFTNPNVYDSDVLAGFNVYHTKKDWDSQNFEVKTKGGGVQAGYPLSFLDHSRAILGYSLYSKKYTVLDWDEDYASAYAKLDSTGWQFISSTSLTLSRDTRNNVYYPSSGSQLSLYSELAGGLFGGDFNYFKQIAQVSWYTNTIWKLVLRTKWRFGYVTSYGSSDNGVPPDEMFSPGGTGADGIRGYADRSIGPDEGGTRELIFSSEYTCPISSDQVIGLLFFDAGDCYNNFEEFNLWKLKKGAGLGIRIRTPFGLIGFDYARNFEDKKWEPHFQFGTTF